MSAIAMRFGPADHAAVPAERRQWQAFEMGDVHACTEKDQFHVRAVHDVRQPYGSFRHGQPDADLQLITVVEIAGDEHGHQFAYGTRVDRRVLLVSIHTKPAAA